MRHYTGKRLFLVLVINMKFALIALIFMSVVVEAQPLPVPLKPVQASDSTPIIRLDVDTTAFPELAAYNNLYFQIDPHGRKYDPGDASETWTRIGITKAVDQPGFYVLSFSNSDRKVSYRARPVFEAQDYDEALKTYERSAAQYRIKLEEKRKAQEEIYEQFILQTAGLGRFDNIDTRVSKYDSLAAATWKKLQKQRLINIDPSDPVSEVGPIDLSHYTAPEEQYRLVTIRAVYQDSAGHSMELKNVDVLFKKISLLGFPDGKQIRVATNGDNMIFGVWKNKLYVLPFDAFHRLHIGPGTKYQKFTMQYVDSIRYDLRYFDLRDLIERYEQRHR